MHPILSAFLISFSWCGVIWCSTVAWRVCSGRTSLCSAATRKWWPSTTVSLPTPRSLLIWRAAAIPPGKLDWADSRFIFLNKNMIYVTFLKYFMFSKNVFIEIYSIGWFLFIWCNESKILNKLFSLKYMSLSFYSCLVRRYFSSSLGGTE